MLTETQRFFKMWYFFFFLRFSHFVSLTPVLERVWMNLTIWLADTEHAGCKQDRGCTCTVFLFGGHSSCILQLLAFIRQKARMNPPANSHERKKPRNKKHFGRVRTHGGMQRWLRMQCTAFLYLYIFISYIQNNIDTQTNARHLILHSHRTKTDQLFLFFSLIKKNSFFVLFSVKVQLN